MNRILSIQIIQAQPNAEHATHKAMKQPTPQKRTTQGFTLIEVAVALLVLGITIGSIFFALGAYTRNLYALSVRTRSHAVAWNEAVLLQLDPPNVLSDETRTVENFGVLWEVSQEITPTVTELIEEVQVRVRPQEDPSNTYSLKVFVDRQVAIEDASSPQF